MPARPTTIVAEVYSSRFDHHCGIGPVACLLIDVHLELKAYMRTLACPWYAPKYGDNRFCIRCFELNSVFDSHAQHPLSSRIICILKRWHTEAKNLIGQIKAGETDSIVAKRLAEVQERLARETPRLTQIREELTSLQDWSIPRERVATLLARFDELWKAMTMIEKQKLLNLLIERIDYDGQHGQVTIHFHPTGLESLLTETLTENAA